MVLSISLRSSISRFTGSRGSATILAKPALAVIQAGRMNVAPSFRRTSTYSTPPCSYWPAKTKGLPSQRMKRIGDRNFLRRNPGTMSPLRIAADRAPLPCTASSSRPK